MSILEEDFEITVYDNLIDKIFYDAQRHYYWMPNDREGWITVSEGSLKRHLKGFGVSIDNDKDEILSELEICLNKIQTEQDICYAGPLAGYEAGRFEIENRRILVTESPKLIIPSPGEWSCLKILLDNMFNSVEIDQRPYVFGWIKIALEALHKQKRRPGQGLVLAGEHDSGKSLFQNLLTHMLGGRSAKPYRFMTGTTDFNSDLFGAEHLMIEDEAASIDLRARRNFGAALKNITVNDTQRFHQKNREALTLTPFWRLSISVNEEPENLMVLPPIDDSIRDKLILLKVQKKEMPLPTETPEERKVFWNTLIKQLPAFVYWLVNEWEIPEELRSQRFGVTHYHHPALLQAIDALSPENKLLGLIDSQIFRCRNTLWLGTASDLEQQLNGQNSEVNYEARRLLNYNTACGVYLARLEKKYPTRFIKTKKSSHNEWEISPP